MSLLDQFFVYHPEPWRDQDWARLSGLPLEDVWFISSGWDEAVWLVCGGTGRSSCHTLVSWQRGEHHQPS